LKDWKWKMSKKNPKKSEDYTVLKAANDEFLAMQHLWQSGDMHLIELQYGLLQFGRKYFTFPYLKKHELHMNFRLDNLRNCILNLRITPNQIDDIMDSIYDELNGLLVNLAFPPNKSKKKVVSKKKLRSKKSKYKMKEGDKVYWEDDEEEFTGEYEISAIRDDVIDDDTRIFIANDDHEIEVTALEINDRIVK